MASVGLALAALVLAVPPEPIALDDLIAFSDPARCEPAAPFALLLDRLWTGRHNRGSGLETVPQRYRSALAVPQLIIGNNGRAIVSVAAAGTWHGLPLRGFDLTAMPDEAAPDLVLVLGVPLQRARATLASEGFRIGTAANGIEISIRPNLGDDGTTILTCAPHG